MRPKLRLPLRERKTYNDDMSRARITVIYDGDCGFCMRSLGVLRELDLFDSFDYVSFHEREKLPDLPELKNADFQNAMYVTADGKAYRGFRAFRRLCWQLPAAWLFAPLAYLPGAAWIGERVYAWVARNRHTLGGSSSCEIPPRK
jgi:predicted DCC family thiol-disulfide oxidoreductase YuxK